MSVTAIFLQLKDVEIVRNENYVNYLATLQKLIFREDRLRYIVELVNTITKKSPKSIFILANNSNHRECLKSLIKSEKVQVSDIEARLAFMMGWHSRLGEYSPLNIIPKDVGKIIAKMLTRPVEIDKDVFLGSNKYYMDIPCNSHIILAEPSINCKQYRSCHVYDIVDNNMLFKRQYNNVRREIYNTDILEI